MYDTGNRSGMENNGMSVGSCATGDVRDNQDPGSVDSLDAAHGHDIAETDADEIIIRKPPPDVQSDGGFSYPLTDVSSFRQAFSEASVHRNFRKSVYNT